MQKNTKQFINDKDEIVRQAQRGLSILLPWAKFDQELNVFAMKPLESHKNKVKLVCGGGSGHEPAHAGYICEQMLYASVNGPIFSSPSIVQILQNLENIIQTDQDQILIIIKKYGGDIINFTEAVKTIKQKYQKINIDNLQVGDDIAIQGEDVTPRGLAGTCLVYKILGAQADLGIQKLKQLGEQITKSLYTLGVAFGACTIPGVGVLHQLQETEIELGMGIHGEKGKQVMKFESCQKLIQQMLNNLEEQLKPCEIVLMLNNLGGVSNIEMGVILDDLMSQIQLKGYKVIRLLSGQYMSSIDMKGFSITFLDLSSFQDKQLILKSIDLKTDSPFWVQSIDTSNLQYKEHLKTEESRNKVEPKTDEGRELVLRIQNGLNNIIQNEEQLSIVDGQTGDGDLGFNASRCAKKLLNEIQFYDFENQLKNTLISLSSIINDHFGGTSGPLWAKFLNSAAQQLNNDLSKINNQDWEKAYIFALDQMMILGGAKKGDRTMVDALLSGKEYLENKKGFIEGLKVGCENVKNLKPKKGRSTYIGEKVIGLKDAGSELALVIFSGLIQ